MNLSESDRNSIAGLGPDTSWIWTVTIAMYPPVTDRVKSEGDRSRAGWPRTTCCHGFSEFQPVRSGWR